MPMHSLLRNREDACAMCAHKHRHSLDITQPATVSVPPSTYLVTSARCKPLTLAQVSVHQQSACRQHCLQTNRNVVATLSCGHRSTTRIWAAGAAKRTKLLGASCMGCGPCTRLARQRGKLRAQRSQHARHTRTTVAHLQTKTISAPSMAVLSRSVGATTTRSAMASQKGVSAARTRPSLVYQISHAKPAQAGTSELLMSSLKTLPKIVRCPPAMVQQKRVSVELGRL